MKSSTAQPDTPSLATNRRGEIRDVIRMSVPMVVAMSTRMLMDVSDYVMIGWVGSDAQAAMLPAQLTIFTFIVLGFGILSTVNTLAAQSYGRREFSSCSVFAWQGLYLAAFFAVAGMLMWPVLPEVVRVMGHTPGVQALERAYTSAAVLTIGPTLAGAALSGFFNGVHRPMVTMWSAVEALVINALVSYGLIFGAWGLPEMGIAGAAYGTLAGGLYRMVRLIWTMCRAKCDAQFCSRRTRRLDWPKMRLMLRVGSPTGLQWVSDVVVWWAFVSILVGRMFGKEHLVASNSAWQYLRIAFLPCIGMGIAVTAMVGKSIGQGDKERAVRLTRVVVYLVSAYMGVFSLLYLFRGGWLISLLSDNPEVIRIGGGVMICAAVFQLFDGLGMTYTNALRGAGDTFWPSIVFVVSHWVILIGGGWAIARHKPEWGSVGPWVAASVLLVFTGVLLWWRWHSRAWMKIDLFAGRPKQDDGFARPNDGIEEPATIDG